MPLPPSELSKSLLALDISEATVLNIVTGLLAGGGILALIQLFLLPRTIAKAKADTASVALGGANTAVQSIQSALAVADARASDLQRQLLDQSTRMAKQEQELEASERQLAKQAVLIEEQQVTIDNLRSQLSLLEARLPHSVAMIIADNTGKILAAYNMESLGWVEDLTGRQLVEIIPPSYRESHLAGLARLVKTGQSHILGLPLSVTILGADGLERKVRLKVIQLHDLYVGSIEAQ